MKGKTCLITGSSQGIGFYTAKGLAEMGAHTIVVSHNEQHCQNAVEKIRESAGKDAARYYVADLSIKDEIYKLAEMVRRDYDRLDVLINNVGTWNASYKETTDGIEETFALNHLSYFLLTGLLIDLLIQSAPARIVNVSSDAHRGIDGIHFDDIGFKENYRPFRTYAQSKLANIMFTYELAKRLEDTNVTANVLHPGSVASKLYRNFGILEPLILFWIKLTGKTSKEGAETPIYLASSPEVKEVSGKYFDEEQNQTRSSEASYDEDAWKRLWQISEEMTDFSYMV